MNDATKELNSTLTADEFYNSLAQIVQTTLHEIAVNLYIADLEGWKELGRLLGFNCRVLEMFLLQAPPRGEIPSLAMLKEWFRHPDCGFHILAGILSEMKRLDCVARIIQCLEAQFQLHFVVESGENGDSYVINVPNAAGAETLLEIGQKKGILPLRHDILTANVSWNTPVYKLPNSGVALRLKSTPSVRTPPVITEASFDVITATDVQTLQRQATAHILSHLRDMSLPGLYLVGRVESADGVQLFLFVTTLGGNILKVPISSQDGSFSVDDHPCRASSIGELIGHFRVFPLHYTSSSRTRRELMLRAAVK